jgi:hypothetical protein
MEVETVMCEKCEQETDRANMWFADWGDVCVECDDAMTEAASKYWYGQWKSAGGYTAMLSDDAYEVSDPKHSGWVERVTADA